MTNHLNFSTQGLNAVFTSLAATQNSVFWVRTPDYKEQLYISESYKHIWHRDPKQLYQDPFSWNKTLAAHYDNRFIQKLFARDEKNDTIEYHIVLPDGSYQYMRDRSFFLYDPSGKKIAVAGISNQISERESRQENQQHNEQLKDALAVIGKDLKLTNQQAQNNKFLLSINNHIIEFTKREAQCLYYLAQGYSAKMIAKKINRSPRTIESHLTNIKNKTTSRTCLELIYKIGGAEKVLPWHSFL